MDRKKKNLIIIGLLMVIIFVTALFFILKAITLGNDTLNKTQAVLTDKRTKNSTDSKEKSQSNDTNLNNKNANLIVENTYKTTDGYLVELLKGSEYREKQIDNNVKLIDRFIKTYSEHLGKDNITLFTIPDKITVLKNKVLLDDFKEEKKETVSYEEKVNYLDKKFNELDIRYLNLYTALSKHQDEYIYYRTDHHWTSLGAMYAYDSILNYTKKDILADLKELKQESVTKDFYGSDYKRSKIETKKDSISHYFIKPADTAKAVIDDSGNKRTLKTIYDKKSLKSDDMYAYYLSGNYGAINVKTGTKNGKSLLLIKDSYSNSLVPFLSMNYENIFMIDLRYANKSVTDYLGDFGKPDEVFIVLNQSNIMSDRHLYNLQ